jgi:hypothetical protein
MSIPEDPSIAASSALENVAVPAGLSTPVATPEALEGTPGVAEGAEGAEVGTGDALPPIADPPFAFDSGAFAGVERSFGISNVVLSDEENPGPPSCPASPSSARGDANDAVAPSLSFSFAAASLASYGSTNPTPFFTEWSQPMKLEVNAGGSRPD